MSNTKYYINMNDGRVIAGTEETKYNICYREIDVSWALAIRDGKTTAKKVIDLINEKIGMIPYSEMMEGIQKLNVRSRDLHMEDHARGLVDEEDVADGPSGVIGAFEDVKPSAAATKAASALKVNI